MVADRNNFKTTVGERGGRSMKYSVILAGLMISLLTTGCMSGYYAHRENKQVMEADSLLPPPMTVDDVIDLAKDSVGDDVIIAQMKATESYFQLTNNDIRDLKKNGVSDRVISAMIKTADQPKSSNRRVAIYPYPDYYWYPYAGYYGPWYSPVYVGFSYRGGFIGGHRMVAGRGFRGRR
jgi:hypothetical protein